MSNEVLQWIIAVIPSILSIISTVSIVIKVLKDFKDLKNMVVDMKSIEDVKSQLQVILNENYSLKKQLNQTLSKIDHIYRGD